MIRTRPPLARMQHIDRELRKNRYPNCSGFALFFDVSRKSIQRDIEFMRDQLGAPIDYDPKRKGYFYAENWVFDPTSFLNRSEADALAVTRSVLAQYQGTPYYDEVCRAIDKLLHALPSVVESDRFFEVYSFDSPSSSHIDQELFSLLEEAIRSMRNVTITYRSAYRQSVTRRTIHPLRLHHDQSTGIWYLIAWCEYRQGIRTFAVGRIQDPLLTGDHFSIPDGFSLAEYIKSTFHQTTGPATYDIRIRFTSYQAQWIREHIWHPSQQLEPHDDGSLTLTMTVSALDAVKRWVMRYGAQAEVLEPKELRDMVRLEAGEMVGVYREKNKITVC